MRSSRGTIRRRRPTKAFDPLFLGFHDWGTWWQGEIAGEYFLSNSNLKSQLVRAQFEPSDAVGGGLMFYKFTLDHPQAMGPSVTDKQAAHEIDAYADWKMNTISREPPRRLCRSRQGCPAVLGRTKNFAYGMVYVAYSF